MSTISAEKSTSIRKTTTLLLRNSILLLKRDEIENEEEQDDEYNELKYFEVIEDIDNNSEDEGFEDYKQGGYHTVHVG